MNYDSASEVVGHAARTRSFDTALSAGLESNVVVAVTIPNFLANEAREIKHPGIAETVDLLRVDIYCYGRLDTTSLTRIIPTGPEIDHAPRDRTRRCKGRCAE